MIHAGALPTSRCRGAARGSRLPRDPPFPADAGRVRRRPAGPGVPAGIRIDQFDPSSTWPPRSTRTTKPLPTIGARRRRRPKSSGTGSSTRRGSTGSSRSSRGTGRSSPGTCCVARRGGGPVARLRRGTRHASSLPRQRDRRGAAEARLPHAARPWQTRLRPPRRLGLADGRHAPLRARRHDRTPALRHLGEGVAARERPRVVSDSSGRPVAPTSPRVRCPTWRNSCYQRCSLSESSRTEITQAHATKPRRPVPTEIGADRTQEVGGSSPPSSMALCTEAVESQEGMNVSARLSPAAIPPNPAPRYGRPTDDDEQEAALTGTLDESSTINREGAPAKVFRTEMNPVDLLARAASMYAEKSRRRPRRSPLHLREFGERAWRLASGLRAAGSRRATGSRPAAQHAPRCSRRISASRRRAGSSSDQHAALGAGEIEYILAATPAPGRSCSTRSSPSSSSRSTSPASRSIRVGRHRRARRPLRGASSRGFARAGREPGSRTRRRRSRSTTPPARPVGRKGCMYTYRGAYLNALSEALVPDCAGVRLPLAAADVPLQRLVLPLGASRGRRPALAIRKVEPDLRLGPDRRRGRHQLQRRPDRAADGHRPPEGAPRRAAGRP